MTLFMVTRGAYSRRSNPVTPPTAELEPEQKAREWLANLLNSTGRRPMSKTRADVR